MEQYGRLLERFRTARGVSQRALAREIDLSHVLLSRSEANARPPSGPDEVAAIARALGLTDDERDQLLASAGFWPTVFLAVGPADATLRRVASVLADPGLSDEAKERFRAAVDALVQIVLLTQPPGERQAPR